MTNEDALTGIYAPYAAEDWIVIPDAVQDWLRVQMEIDAKRAGKGPKSWTKGGDGSLGGAPVKISRAKVIQLAGDGMSVTQISAALSCTGNNIRAILRNAGVKPGCGVLARFARGDDDAIAQAYIDGMPTALIRADLRVTSERLMRIIKARGIPLRGRARVAA